MVQRTCLDDANEIANLRLVARIVGMELCRATNDLLVHAVRP
jgi:hypothetical protein